MITRILILLLSYILSVCVPSSQTQPTVINESLPPSASILYSQCDKTSIDVSTGPDGYVIVGYDGRFGDDKIKLLVNGPKSRYSYLIDSTTYEMYPLTEGNGTYDISLFRNIKGDYYDMICSRSTKVELEENDLSIYLMSNYYVRFDKSDTIRALAEQITHEEGTRKEKIAKIAKFVKGTIAYDYVNKPGSGYRSDLEETLNRKQGVCIDQASLACGMLRSIGIPCKLIFGDRQGVYHAWIEACTGYDDFGAPEWKMYDVTTLKKFTENDYEVKYVF